jgi:hypothetical protein
MADGACRVARAGDDPRAGALYAYLVYPHRPIVACLPQTELLNEYRVESWTRRALNAARAGPDSDDVLAGWRSPATSSTSSPPRTCTCPAARSTPQVRRDLWRLGQWERERACAARRLLSLGGAPRL